MSKSLNEPLFADVRLMRAFRLLEENNLLYFRVLRQVNILIDPEFQAPAGVAFNSKNNKVYMIFKEDVLVNGSDKDIAGLCEHECGHVFLEHIFNQDPGVNHALMNIARDLLINDSCLFITDRIDEIKNSGGVLSKGCFFKDFQKKYPVLQKYNSQDLTSLQLYEILKKEAKEEQKQNQSGKGQQQKGQGEGQGQSEGSDQGDGQPQEGNGSGKPGKGKPKKDQESDQSQSGCQGENQEQSEDGQGFDSHEIYEITEDENGNEKATPVSGKKAEDQKEVMSNVVKGLLNDAIEQLRREGQLSKAIGQLRGAMAFHVQEMIKSRTDKNSIFNFITRLPVGAKRTWTKLHRRYPYLAKGKRKDRKAKVLMVVDTSGSMGGETLFKLIAHQAQILVNRCEQLCIVTGDTQLETMTMFKRKNDFQPEKIAFAGGGGTDLQFGWDYAKEHGFDGVIVHTDGHIGQFDDHGKKTIFYLYGENNAAEIEGYQNIYVFPE